MRQVGNECGDGMEVGVVEVNLLQRRTESFAGAVLMYCFFCSPQRRRERRGYAEVICHQMRWVQEISGYLFKSARSACHIEHPCCAVLMHVSFYSPQRRKERRGYAEFFAGAVLMYVFFIHRRGAKGAEVTQSFLLKHYWLRLVLG